MKKGSNKVVIALILFLISLIIPLKKMLELILSIYY